MRSKIVLSAAAAVAAVVLAACGTDTTPAGSSTSHDMAQMSTSMIAAPESAAASGPMSKEMPTATDSAAADPSVSKVFNDADVTFAQDMILHHMQAIEMADMVPARTKNPEVTALGSQIMGAQQPEITQLLAFLTAWGKKGPTHDMGHANGMMSDTDMASLNTLNGAEFDQKWLTMMIEHHQGAIDMAKTELDTGSNPETKALAGNIVTAQQAEIAAMKALLG